MFELIIKKEKKKTNSFVSSSIKLALKDLNMQINIYDW